MKYDCFVDLSNGRGMGVKIKFIVFIKERWKRCLFLWCVSVYLCIYLEVLLCKI